MKKPIVCLMSLLFLLCGCNNQDHNIIAPNPNEPNINNAENLSSSIINFQVYEALKTNGNNLMFGDVKTIEEDNKYNEFKEWLNTAISKAVKKDDSIVFPTANFDNEKVTVITVYEMLRKSDFSLVSISENNNLIDVNVKEICERSYASLYSYSFVFLKYSKDKNYEFKLNYQDDCSQEVTEKKPIIYFYPEQEMDLNVRFVNEDKLLTTYPKYNGGWNIHLNKDGTFTTNDNNREYYALYYEAESNYECTFEEGFNVNKDSALTFLEEKMDYIGFNNKEVNEFIMYWLPILENNVNSLVYFEQTEERNEECPLEFSTSPDSLIRVIMHVKKVNEAVNVKEQELKHYERVGFTVTEWGGIEY